MAISRCLQDAARTGPSIRGQCQAPAPGVQLSDGVLCRAEGIPVAAGTPLYRGSSSSSAPRIQPTATQTAEDRAKNCPHDDAEEGIADDHEAASFEVALASYLGSVCLMASHDAANPAPDDSAESQTEHEEANDDAPPLHAAPLRFTGSWSLCLLLQRSHLSPTLGLAAVGEQRESHPFRAAKLLILQVGGSSNRVDEHEQRLIPDDRAGVCWGFRSMALVKLGTLGLGPLFRVRAFACECLDGSPAVAHGRRYVEGSGSSPSPNTRAIP